jgi:hypothetical protein
MEADGNSDPTEWEPSDKRITVTLAEGLPSSLQLRRQHAEEPGVHFRHDLGG